MNHYYMKNLDVLLLVFIFGVDKNRIVWRGPRGGLFFYNSSNKRSLIVDSSLVKFDELLF
jgi:hypothetical protein